MPHSQVEGEVFPAPWDLSGSRSSPVLLELKDRVLKPQEPVGPTGRHFPC